MIYIFTDGGAKNNGKVNCNAAWAVFFADNDSRNESGPILVDPSNQKAELFAIHKALTKVPVDEKYDIYIVTDSQYSIDCLTKWYKAWQKNGWKTAKKENVKHSVIIKDSLEILNNNKNIKFLHVNSHQVPPADQTSPEYAIWYGNYMVDKMVSEQLALHQPPKWVQPKGKAIEVDWDGNVKEIDVDVDKFDKKKKQEKTDEQQNFVQVSW